MTKQKRSKFEQQLVAYRASVSARHALREWYKTPLGLAVHEQESRKFKTILPNLFGYHLVQFSQHAELDYLETSTIRHRIILDLDNYNLASDINLRCNPHQVAIACDSVDVVVLPHTLEVDMSPHQVLREVDRILVPEGKVVITGFNPWSHWGMRKLCNPWSKKSPWDLNFVSPFRLKDWLSLLGFEIETVETFFYRPPIGHPLAVNKLHIFDKIGAKLWPAFGGVYIMVANKKVSTMTPIRPRWYMRHQSPVNPGFIETRKNES